MWLIGSACSRRTVAGLVRRIKNLNVLCKAELNGYMNRSVRILQLVQIYLYINAMTSSSSRWHLLKGGHFGCCVNYSSVNWQRSRFTCSPFFSRFDKHVIIIRQEDVIGRNTLSPWRPCTSNIANTSCSSSCS